MLEFLYFLFDSRNLGYSAMNTIRSALSTLVTVDGIPVGKHHLVTRFLKGIFNLKPSLPKNAVIWDVDQVLSYLKNLGPCRKLSLKLLTYKLTTLLAILSGQRKQSLHFLDVRNMQLSYSKVVFNIGDLVKQSKPGKHVQSLSLSAYAPDRRLCVVTTLKEYLQRTLDIRGKENRLLLAIVAPHAAVSKDTIGRWIKNTLRLAGIDIKIFTPHSTRSASMTCALGKHVPLASILKTAGWSKGSTFRKYYLKPVVDQTVVSKALLENMA